MEADLQECLGGFAFRAQGWGRVLEVYKEQDDIRALAADGILLAQEKLPQLQHFLTLTQ